MNIRLVKFNLIIATVALVAGCNSVGSPAQDWRTDLYNAMGSEAAAESNFKLRSGQLQIIFEDDDCNENLHEYLNNNFVPFLSRHFFVKEQLRSNPSKLISGHVSESSPLDSICEDIKLYSLIIEANNNEIDTISINGLMDRRTGMVVPVNIYFISFGH